MEGEEAGQFGNPKAWEIIKRNIEEGNRSTVSGGDAGFVGAFPTPTHDQSLGASPKRVANRRSYPEPPFWVTEITYEDGSKEWEKEDLEQAIKAGRTKTWTANEEKIAADAAAAADTTAAHEAAAAKQREIEAKAESDRLATAAAAERDRIKREQDADKSENRTPIPAIPATQQDIKNTGPITGAVEGQYFGDKDKYGLKLGKGGVAPGGGNPNEMYRWFKEAMISNIQTRWICGIRIQKKRLVLTTSGKYESKLRVEHL